MLARLVVAGVPVQTFNLARIFRTTTCSPRYKPPVTTRIHAVDGSLIGDQARERGSTSRSRRCRISSRQPSCRQRTRISTSLPASTSPASAAPWSSHLRKATLAGGRWARRRSPSRWRRTSCCRTSGHTTARSGDPARLRIEQAYSKDRILELYVNEIFSGSAPTARRRGADLVRQAGQ